MSDQFALFVPADPGALLAIVTRLAIALVLGRIVAAVYRRSRPMGDEAESFVVTLVLLTVLIAMVTQVIGDNVARAFSLVGALSIVRFRTVVRDTQDTAYVIFAVAIGMAVGANHPAVAICGLAVIAFAALVVMRPRSGSPLECGARPPVRAAGSDRPRSGSRCAARTNAGPVPGGETADIGRHGSAGSCDRCGIRRRRACRRITRRIRQFIEPSRRRAECLAAARRSG